MKKLIEHFDDYNMTSSKSEINKHNYIRYRMGRLKHEFWLKNRKSNSTILIDEYDKFIVDNLQQGNTCFFGSAGYYIDQLVDNLTVIEQWPIVQSFYPEAKIVEDRRTLESEFPRMFDNFVVVNNRGDIWCTLKTVEQHISYYVTTMKTGCLFFYSFRDTQIVDWNRLTEDHYTYFYNFAKHIESTYSLNLIWHDIKFADKSRRGDGTFDMLENPDTTNGNIKFIFQYKERTKCIE